jgi:hypothetical protein
VSTLCSIGISIESLLADSGFRTTLSAELSAITEESSTLAEISRFSEAEAATHEAAHRPAASPRAELTR